ncbi:MAG TPA: NAD-glutamate dehydrogenase, partial [Rhodospirillales bacterium]|nr:NAD-glutamate dehydrogenase [Rhodospirillales bacterium]
FALGGGLAYADSIDNSAGVDCSDHEVNIKILIDQVVDNGDLTMKQRNILLASMTEEVGDLVLRDNYLQTQAINTIKTEGISVLDSQIRLMRMLEKNGRLNREVEFLPDDETLIERAASNVGLVAPEISVLMPHSKLWVYDELLNSDLPDDSYLAEDLLRYFPTPLRKKFKEAISKHRLRREIVATRVTNSMINRVGGSFVNRMVERTGMRPEDIAGSYIVAREIFGLRSLWDSIEGLDNEVPPLAQTEMLLEINKLIEWGTLWFLRNGRRPLDITTLIGEYAKGIAALSVDLEKILPVHYHDDIRDRAAPVIEQGVPTKIALWVAGLVNLYSACDIVRLACSRKLDVAEVGKLYFEIGTRYRLGRMRAATERLDTQTHWQKLAAVAMTEELYGHQLALTSQVLDASGGVGRGKSVEAAIGKWEKKNNAAIERTELLLSELWATEITGLSMIAVASRQLRTLVETPQE